MISSFNITGLGEIHATINVYTVNRPPIEPYVSLSSLQPLEQGDIAYIVATTGNHWRKVFNVFAKILFQLTPMQFETWQHYRDNLLLQQGSSHVLWFVSREQTTSAMQTQRHILPSHKYQIPTVHLIMGKTCASSMFSQNILTEQFVWIDDSFAINVEQNIIICPYFDYRQLSNLKITQLVKLIKSLIKN